MRKLALLISVVFMSGCFDDTSDLQAHMEKVKAETRNYIEPIPEAPQFNHVDYSASDLRSPFVAPRPEVIQEKLQQMSGCLSPDPRRRKQPLEKYALSDLVMRGTIGEGGVTWALIEASDTSLHRVSIGNYVGLYNGRITEVGNNIVKVIELTPDGAGCWVERETVIDLAQQDG